MPKESLKDKLDGNELDLSLSNLEVVPVKELASIPKATQLDLSCNLLTSLPDSFCSLVHLVKIDLSKNRLTELPRDFGQLENLQHLDLLGNQLVSLPESFHRLQKLKWLDLKDNPLEPQLKKNAGDCLDEKQCRICAQRILLFMKDLSEELEKKRQKKLQQQKDKEAEKKAREEALARKKREEKKAEKEKRKREAEAKRVEQRPTGPTEEKVKRNDSTPDGASKRSAKDARPRSSSCCTVLLSIFALLVALVVGIVFHCRSNLQDQLCLQYYKPMEGQVLEAADVTWQHAEFLYKTTDKQSAEWYQVAATKSVEGYELLSASAKSAFKSVMEFFTFNDETSS